MQSEFSNSEAIPDMTVTTELIGQLSIPTMSVAIALMLALAAFAIWFFLPALAQNAKLKRYLLALKKIDKQDLEAHSKVFADDETVSHLWDEFRDTLHEQRVRDASGTTRILAIRQTVPAETYFTEQVLVHSPIKAEFFKHLPGILTGIGIIGTFSGLIIGLQAFNVSSDPDAVRQSLNGLLHGVFEAFVASAAAIFLAMFVTTVEKLLVTNLYQRLEDLCLELDSRFDAGAGEEYLSRLVESSEASATETKQLKQSLVNDLKDILETLTERQIQAQSATMSNVAREIVTGVNESLQAPLAGIDAAVKHVSGNQGDAVNKLLTDTMAAMTAQIRDLFSGQVDGIRGMQQQTIDSLGQAVRRLEQLVSDISTSGAKTTDAMSAQLAAAVASLEARQIAMNEQTQALVDTLRVEVSKSQQATSDGVKEAIERMGGAVGELTSALHASVQKASERDDQRSRSFAEQATAYTATTSDLSKELVKQTGEAIAAMRQSVDAMRTTTSDTVSRMNLGAADMLKAAGDMARAGSTTGSALERAQSLAEQLSTASSAVSNAMATFNRVIDDHKSTRDSVATMVEQLKHVVENAKVEASLTADILKRIESSAQSLRTAQSDAQKYLDGISEVLASAHQTFGAQVISTLNSVNGEFHKHVERGTKALAGAIDELDLVLDRVGGQGR